MDISTLTMRFSLTLAVLSVSYEISELRNDGTPKLVKSEKSFDAEPVSLSPEELERSALNRLYNKIRSFKAPLSDSIVYRIAKATYDTSIEEGIDEDLILAIIRTESNFNVLAVSSAGARGLTQLMPFWGKVYPDCKDTFNIQTSIRCGVRVYMIYLEQYGDKSLALAAYNRGPSVINREKRMGKDPTRGYTQDVMVFYDKLKMEYNSDTLVASN